jgi:hypothetical protein
VTKFGLRMLVLFLFVGLGSSLLAFQHRGGGIEMDGEYFPPDGTEHVEWLFSRLHFNLNTEFGGFRGFQRWAADYPKSDRQFIMGVQRLTRLNTRSTGQVVEPVGDEIFNSPWLYAEDPGAWTVTPAQGALLREYLLKGGFLFLDDSHGDLEWGALVTGLRVILPDRPIEDLSDDDELFHVFYDLNDRAQIPGTRYIWGGRRYTPDSAIPRWRGVRDSKGRIIVAICHNSDVGDAWEWADSPNYPENLASIAYRIGINYIIYSMTH